MKKTTGKSETKSSGNIFTDLGFQPHEAAVMLLRCELAEALRVKAFGAGGERRLGQGEHLVRIDRKSVV